MPDPARLPEGLELYLYPAVSGSDGSFRRPPSPRVCEPGDLVPPGVSVEGHGRGVPTVSVDANRAGASSVVLAGPAAGNLAVTASALCHARREGDGAGNVDRWGEGPGTCLRDGLGDGNAVSHSPGAYALRTGNGSGTALDAVPADRSTRKGTGEWWRQTIDRALHVTSKLPAAVATTVVLTAALTGVGSSPADPKAREAVRGSDQRQERVVEDARGHLLGQRPELAIQDVERRPTGAAAERASGAVQYGSVRTPALAEAVYNQLHYPSKYGERGRLVGSRGHHQVTLQEAVDNVQRAHRAGRAVVDMVSERFGPPAAVPSRSAAPAISLGGGADLPEPGVAPRAAAGSASARSAPERSAPYRP